MRFVLVGVLCVLFVVTHAQNLRPHDFSNFSIRLKMNEGYGKRNLQDPTIRHIRSLIDAKIHKFSRLTDSQELILPNERSIDEIKHIIQTESNDMEIYQIEETYKQSEEYIRYMNQEGSSSMAYHNYTQLYEFLQYANAQNPDMTSVFSIGQSTAGRELWGIRINTATRAQVPQSMDMSIPLPKPKFKYIGNMHGDETVGREILLKLVDYLLTEYRNSTNTRVKKLLDSVDLYILPSMNPDGYELVQRTNANGYDLNRNFPDQFLPYTQPTQAEVSAIMSWVGNHSFVLSTNFHGGAVVANYPWDGLPSGRITNGIYSKNPDDAFFIYISKVYANNHKTMVGAGFPNGITNGARWYTLYGGMQDYNYINVKCPEITVELSNIKNPPAAQLEAFWNENKEALLAYMENIYRAIAGSIVVYPGGNPVQVPCNLVFSSTSTTLRADGSYNYTLPVPARDSGFYYKLLYPATYDLTLNCEGYLPKQAKGLTVESGATNPVVKNWVVSKQDTCIPNC
jgi:carboxypeptidase D